MWAWDRYRPQLKSSAPDISFVSSSWILVFVFAIASAPCDFLYLNNEYMIYKKKKEKKEKKALYVLHLSRPLHLQRLKSQHHAKSSWECPPPLIYPARGNCSGVYQAFISLLSLRPLASPPGGYGFLSGSVRLR